MIRDSKELKREIFDRYNKNPKNWRVLVGKDPNRYTVLYVVHGTECWIIKEEYLNPMETIGVGINTKISKKLRSALKMPYDFGLRPIDEEENRALFSKDRGSVASALDRILKGKPRSIDEIDAGPVLQGPIIKSNQNCKLISPVDAELTEELDKLLNRKGIFNSYI